MKMETLVALLPCFNFGVFVRGIIIADDVHLLIGWCAVLDCIQKLDPLLMTMLWHAGSDDFTVGDVKCCKQ